MRILRAAAFLLIAATAGAAGCNPCPLQALDRLRVEWSVGCCGASAAYDVDVPDEDNLQIDLAHAAPLGAPRVDAFLTATTCDRLFDQPYTPGATAPLCEVLLGPVMQGSVSSRRGARPGKYRVWIQGAATNTVAVSFVSDVGVWGRSCRSPIRP